MLRSSADMVRAWGREASLTRAGITLIASFKARRAEIRPEDKDLINSVSQEQFVLIAAADDLASVGVPIKFDVVTYEGTDYTVQTAHGAGRATNELIKMTVIGGEV